MIIADGLQPGETRGADAPGSRWTVKGLDLRCTRSAAPQRARADVVVTNTAGFATLSPSSR